MILIKNCLILLALALVAKANIYNNQIDDNSSDEQESNRLKLNPSKNNQKQVETKQVFLNQQETNNFQNTSNNLIITNKNSQLPKTNSLTDLLLNASNKLHEKLQKNELRYQTDQKDRHIMDKWLVDNIKELHRELKQTGLDFEHYLQVTKTIIAQTHANFQLALKRIIAQRNDVRQPIYWQI